MLGSPVPSPCTSVCTMSPQTGLCAGCLRTIEEIAGWGQMTDAKKMAVVGLISDRKSRIAPNPNGLPTAPHRPKPQGY
jgi:predicted Fe-S protein YdhL (DUF1289 family)